MIDFVCLNYTMTVLVFFAAMRVQTRVTSKNTFLEKKNRILTASLSANLPIVIVVSRVTALVKVLSFGNACLRVVANVIAGPTWVNLIHFDFCTFLEFIQNFLPQIF